MAARVGIVDYQMGNLRSVQKALESFGTHAFVSGNPHELQSATHLILPGVGAFRDAMAEIRRRDLIGLLRNWAQSGRPFLGVCLGLQLLFETSDEGGVFEGLAILPGKVVRFEPKNIAPETKIPHMGWNRVVSNRDQDEMLVGIPDQPFFYFVHSYYVEPADPALVWLQADYGRPFCAGVRSGNILATQFHPEKSQRNGLRLLQNFVSLGEQNERVS
jgi:imidazole glycerol-phosphate synthase subunit HisH